MATSIEQKIREDYLCSCGKPKGYGTLKCWDCWVNMEETNVN